MWVRSSIRDLLETMVAAAPDSGEALMRVRAETLHLLLALFGPPEGEPDAALRERIILALDAVMAERIARRPCLVALEPV
jgi:hypothetical protein